MNKLKEKRNNTLPKRILSSSEWDEVRKIADKGWEEYCNAWIPRIKFFKKLVRYSRKEKWYKQFFKMATNYYVDELTKKL